MLNYTGRERRKRKVRAKVIGTVNKPRLSVFRSNKHIYASLVVDDKPAKTTLKFSDLDLGKNASGKTKSEAAYLVGEILGKAALAKKITHVVFDRNGYKYHGRVKQIAEGARKAGLNL